MPRKILITRGYHPEEVSAFYLAPKVAESLKRIGEDATLYKFPFERTELCEQMDWLKGEDKDETEYDLVYFRKLKLPRSNLHIDFHNSEYPQVYKLIINPEDIQVHVKSIREFGDPRNITFYHDYGSGSSRLTRKKRSHFLEIPAIWNNSIPYLMKRYGFYKEMVDFPETKKHGLVGEVIIEKIVKGILNLL